ncbi:hypothetical protein E2C01_063204 [Portunus trituberculatus]|uniref:Uncharacterized protein n=1 Tax=Portunus trituberculatus TaxID=210409 RepID=A0A5B7H8K2_PORTR|nr:hypothetical protein [Portunus trituberculatus]
MGCGASRVVQAIEEDPEKSPAPPDQQQQQHQPDELTSVRSNTPDQPDQASRPVDPPSSGPVIQSNGTEHSAPTLEDNLPKSPVERKAPHSGKTNEHQQQSKAYKASTHTPHLGEDAPHPSLPFSPVPCRGTLAHRTPIAPVAALLFSSRT